MIRFGGLDAKVAARFTLFLFFFLSGACNVRRWLAPTCLPGRCSFSLDFELYPASDLMDARCLSDRRFAQACNFDVAYVALCDIFAHERSVP